MIRLLLIQEKGPAGSALRDLLTEITEMTIQVECATGPGAGLATLAEREPDLCLVDEPTVEILEWVSVLRDRGQRIPIVLWVALHDLPWARQAAQLPAVHYLVKEGSTAVVIELIIRHAIQRHRSEAALEYYANMQRVVAEVGQTALADGSLGSLMDDCLAGVTQALGLEYAKVLELMPCGETLVLRAGRGWKESWRVGRALVTASSASQAGYTLLSATPVIVEDLATEIRFEGPPLLRDHGVVSGISVIIPGVHKPYGVLGVHSRRIRSFGSDEVNFLSAIANILAQAILRHQARESLHRVNRLLALLNDCSQVLVKSEEEADFLTRLCQLIVTADGYHMAWFGCRDDHGQLVERARAGRALDSDHWVALEAPNELAKLAMDSGTVQIHSAPDEELGYRCIAALPLQADGQVLGVLSIISVGRGPFECQEVDLLARLADNSGAALLALRARAYRKMAAERDARLASILESSSDAIMAANVEGIVTEWSPGAERTFGYSMEEMIGRPVSVLAPSERVQEVPFILERILRGENVEYFETVRLRKDGSRLEIWMTVSPLRDADGRIIGGCSIAKDITARNRGERELSENRAQLASIIETAMHAIISVGEDQRILLFNRAAEQMFGYSASEAVGQPLDLLLPERWRLSHHQHVSSFGSAAQATKNMGERLTVYGLRANGEEFPLEASISQLSINGKKLHTAIIRDVTVRVQTQERLNRSEAQFRALFENALDAVLVADDQACYVDANPAACSLLGVSRQQIVGSRLHDYLKPGQHEQVTEVWQAFLVAGLQRGVTRVYRPDGTRLVVDYTATANFVPGLHLSILRDVSEQRRLEEQFRQSQKLEAVGQLAGGIAHDFNNLLMVILGYTDEALHEVAGQQTVQDHLKEIHLAASRATALTRQLLAFSRKQIVQPRVLDLNQILAGLQGMLKRLIGENIKLETRLCPTLPSVRADLTQIQQVVMNLVVNARDAMPQGGEIYLETREVTLDSEYLSHHLDVQPGRYAMLAVTDTGIGMTQETQKRVFEPFFTTKKTGEGTGLGLSTVFGIVKQAEGNVWVYSEPGLGSVFKVYLPGLAQGSENPVPDSFSKNSVGLGTETLLIVEDDEALRRLITRVFATSGYTLLVACDGPSALTLAAQYPQTIHLLLTDVVMPGMPGSLVAERLRASRPEMKVLFMSGYTADAVVLHGIEEGQTNFIQKPFSPANLKLKVRGVLDGE